MAQQIETIITNLDKLRMKQANAAQKRWIEKVAEFGKEELGILYDKEWAGAPFHIHHVLGRSAKHNKVAIGHWFILPVPIALHDPNLNHEYHVGKCKKAFTKKFGGQCGLFQEMVGCMLQWGYCDDDDLPKDIYNAIMDTNA